MPPAALKHVLNAQREFMNSGKSSMVSREQLMAPREEGGLGMLDLKARNEAIQLVKTSDLVETDPKKRSHWASLARHNLKQRVIKHPVVAENARSEVLVQDYKINQRTHPAQHKDMMKSLTDYGFGFQATTPSVELQRRMPLWHHPGEDKSKVQGINGMYAKCL
jgi:hypothetical protein